MESVLNSPAAPTLAETRWIHLDHIVIPPDARTHDPEKLQELAQDMKAQGQLQEIVVAEQGPSRFDVLAGVGRTLAARRLGWSQIRASVRTQVSEFDRARITFAENEDREDADPFYQAAQLLKMLKARSGGTRQDLAKDLGISDSLIDAYMAIYKLPDEIKASPKRLGLGQLIQVSRLKDEKEQIQIAEKAKKEDFSVRQLKALVDHMTGRPLKIESPDKPSRPVAPPDPLAKAWPSLQAEAAISGTLWGVTYGMQALPEAPNMQVPAWRLWFANMGPDPRADLAGWLRWLADSLEAKPAQPARTAQPSKPTNDIFAAAPSNPQVQQIQQESYQTRLPQTPAEQAELEALAAQGPGAVYAWINGADSVTAKAMSATTWQDLDYPDPITGCRQLVKTLEMIAEHDRH